MSGKRATERTLSKNKPLQDGEKDKLPGMEEKRGRSRSAQFHFLQTAFDTVADPIIVLGTDFRIKLMNQAAREFALCKDDRADEKLFCYQLLFNLNSPCDGKGYPCPLIEVLETGERVKLEQTRPMADGSERTIELLASPLTGETGDLLGIVESIRDITELKQISEAFQDNSERLSRQVEEQTAELRYAKERAEQLYRVCPTAVFTVDSSGKTTSWNDRAESLTGYVGDEMIGRDGCRIFNFAEKKSCCLDLEDGFVPFEEKICNLTAKKGDELIVALNFNRLLDKDDHVVGGIGSFKDITEQKRVERILRSERDKFESMLSAMDQGMHIVNKQFEIEFQNDVLRRTFGDTIGEKCYNVYRQRNEPCEVCRMHEAIEKQALQRVGEILLGGRYYQQCYAPFVDIDGDSKALVLLNDITEEKVHQAETMRAAQLASIGELSAGVAHEINNPINGIINYAQLLTDEAAPGPEKEILERIIKEGGRIAGIVRNLLFFSRQHDEDLVEVNIETVINDSLALILHQMRKDGIALEVDASATLPSVCVSAQHLQQVFLNLLSNARHALNQRYSGADPNKKLSIQCSVVERGDEQYVRTQVIDHGMGISEDIIGHIFDPFFSSKDPGEGTGLGLSISQGLIRDIGGFIGVESVHGDHTIITVDIPVCKPGTIHESVD
ncbi:MAG: PAS domain-containing protein [Desulfobulbaceae bacterium]|nr:PAS domain-containing protein [Desulfobulbaceae bacterium]